MLNYSLAVCTLKGGTYKTSVTVALSAIYAQKGWKILVVSGDNQGDIRNDFNMGDNITRTEANAATESLIETIEAIVENPDGGVVPAPKPLLQVRDNIDLLPGGRGMNVIGRMLAKDVEERSSEQEDPDPSMLLAKAIATIEENYDMVIIDVPPYDENVQLACLAASRLVISPVIGDRNSIQEGAGLAAEKTLRVRKSVNPAIQYLGGVLVGVEPPNKSGRAKRTQVERALWTENLPLELLFDAEIRRCLAGKQLRDHGIVVTEHEARVKAQPRSWTPEGKALRAQGLYLAKSETLSDDYHALAQEVMERASRALESQPSTEKETERA